MITHLEMDVFNGPSIIHPDEIERHSILHTNTPVSDMSFDEFNEFRKSDCASSTIIELNNDAIDWNKLLEETGNFGQSWNRDQFDITDETNSSGILEKDLIKRFHCQNVLYNQQSNEVENRIICDKETE
jgi:hypothetical protein